jgi:xylulokinase
MESAVYGLKTGLDAFRAQDCSVTSVRLTGGGSRSATWRQMVADIFNLPVSIQTVDEGAALGAALQALWMHQSSQGSSEAITDLVDDHLSIDHQGTREPSPQVVTEYQQHYQQYLRHVKAVTPLYI